VVIVLGMLAAYDAPIFYRKSIALALDKRYIG